jgi:hypothetical protein
MTTDVVESTGEEDGQCWREELLSLLVVAFSLAKCCTIATQSSGNANQYMVELGNLNNELQAVIETKDRT